MVRQSKESALKHLSEVVRLSDLDRLQPLPAPRAAARGPRGPPSGRVPSRSRDGAAAALGRLRNRLEFEFVRRPLGVFLLPGASATREMPPSASSSRAPLTQPSCHTALEDGVLAHKLAGAWSGGSGVREGFRKEKTEVEEDDRVPPVIETKRMGQHAR